MVQTPNSIILKGHNGNIRWHFIPELPYYGLEKPIGGGHKSWVSVVSAKNPEELKDKAQQHYANLRKKNPVKYQEVIAPVAGF